MSRCSNPSQNRKKKSARVLRSYHLLSEINILCTMFMHVKHGLKSSLLDQYITKKLSSRFARYTAFTYLKRASNVHFSDRNIKKFQLALRARINYYFFLVIYHPVMPVYSYKNCLECPIFQAGMSFLGGSFNMVFK